MSEAEYDLLLDTIRSAVAPALQEDVLSMLAQAPRAANDNARHRDDDAGQVNDNRMAWDLIPFPDGWNAVC